MLIPVLLDLLWKVPMLICFLSLGEWLVHRWVLHGRWIYDHVAAARHIYRYHAIQHHALEQNEKRPHINLTPLDYWLLYPFVIFHAYRFLAWGQPGGLSSLIAIVLVCVTHMLLWNTLHQSIHEETPTSWISRMPGYNTFREHHLKHHKNTRTNYGVVCVWIDYILGTEYDRWLDSRKD